MLLAHACTNVAKRKLVQSTLPMMSAFFLDGGTIFAKRPKTCVAAAAANNKKQVLKYTLTIYGYRRCVGDDAWPYVYVGQTRCHLDARDAQHLANDGTRFDQAYSARREEFKGPEVLEQTTMSRKITIDSYQDQAALLADCQKWMNKREIHYINEYGTYSKSLDVGLNMTSGGQKGMTQAYFEAQLKKAAATWEKTYLPAFRASPYGQKNRLWEIPTDFKQGEVKIGMLLHNMRTGNTLIPPRFLAELNVLGYNDGKSFQDCRWEIDRMPAFRASSYGQQGRLWEIPTDFKQGEVKLGRLLNGMRTGHTPIPPGFLAELNALGYNDGKSFQDCKWDIDYMPAFRTSSYGQQGRLWEIPQDFTQGEVKLGVLLSCMRTGDTLIPPRFLEELTALGYNDGKSQYDSKWEIDYMPAFRASSYGQHGRLWDMPTDFKQGEVKLGQLLVNMRTGNTPIPSRFLVELNDLGYNDGKTKQDCTWEVDYMPAFRTSPYGQKNRLWEMPQDFKQGEVKYLGTLLSCMRTGDTSIPPRFLEELNALGYNDGRTMQDCKWEIDYMPAFRTSRYGQQGRIWEIPTGFKQDEVNLGRLLSNMRTRKDKTILPQFLEELNALGYNDGKSFQDCKFEIDCLPAIYEWRANNENPPICKIPAKCKVNSINIGSLVHRMRTGTRKVPEQHLQELKDIGLFANPRE